MQGIRERDLSTRRLRVHLRESGSGTPVVLLHGNCASGIFFEELLAALPEGFWGIAPDLRGYGETEPLPVDGSRGSGDWSDDLDALAETLGLDRFHLLGWSMGGGIAMHYALTRSARLLSLTLMAPTSPYGVAATKGADGVPCYDDFAGGGGGIINPEFAKRIAEGDRGSDSPFSPRNTMNQLYFKAPFRGTPEQEERWLTSVLSTKYGLDHYPGDFVTSTNWPGVAPGTRGIGNAFSAKYHNVAAFSRIDPKPPVLWVRGDGDAIVSDTSLIDPGYLGSLGFIPGWPGAEVFPAQPMVSQTRAVLEEYRANGGFYEEVILDAGHSPHVERPAEFSAAFFRHLAR